jgi:uncharacterized protein (DUF1330 family)
MPAYMIVHFEITDPAAFDAYRKVAGPTVAAYGGKALAAFGRFEVLEGMIHPKSVLIEFVSVEQAKSDAPGRHGIRNRALSDQADGVLRRRGQRRDG